MTDARSRLRRVAAEFNKRMNLPKRWLVDGEPAPRAIIIRLRFAGYARRSLDKGGPAGAWTS
jgi:hypothetical protein